MGEPRFDELKGSCSKRPGNVCVRDNALMDARAYFGGSIETEEDLKAYIAEGGCDTGRSQIQSEPLRFAMCECPVGTEIYAYSFNAGLFEAYLAFMEKPTKDHWCIKSFHKR